MASIFNDEQALAIAQGMWQGKPRQQIVVDLTSGGFPLDEAERLARAAWFGYWQGFDMPKIKKAH
jgi:hypothetical protein